MASTKAGNRRSVGGTATRARAPARTPGAPGRKRRGEGRGRILAAALDMFADLGFEAVSTSDIAKAAGSSQSVVIYHFGSKEQLWREAMRLLFTRIDVRLTLEKGIFKDLAPVDRLRILLRSFVMTSARMPQLGRVMFREGANGGDRLRWLIDELARTQYKLFVEALQDLEDLGVMKPYNPVMLALMIHGAGATLFNLSPLSEILLERDPFEDDIVGQQADMLVDTFFGGLILPQRQG